MDTLQGYRKRIDEIDSQMAELFSRRMDAVAQVAAYKREHDMAVLQPGRESEVLERAASAAGGWALATESFFRAMMDISKTYQAQSVGEQADYSVSPGRLPESPRAAFQGVAGSFSEQALIELFGEEAERIPCNSFEDVFRAIGEGNADCGVLPIENSSTGSISQVYDLLLEWDFKIVGERSLPVEHCLLGVSGAGLEDVREVYSHAQGFEQSRAFLKHYGDWRLIPYHNTALSARLVAQSQDPAKAAIASRRAGALYGLSILEAGIQDQAHNHTRFIVVARETLAAPGADKISIVFSVRNEPGALYRTLSVFALTGVNLIKLESRPVRGGIWEYVFYADFEGDIGSQRVQAALRGAGAQSSQLKLLGAYPKSSAR